MSLKIGNEILEYGVMLAPMAGYTDRAFRVVAARCGVEWSVTEMVSAKATVYGDKKTRLLAGIRADEGRVALQLFGKEPDVIAEAAGILSSLVGDGFVAPRAIDINMGCPVNKIFSNGEGSALMKSPELIRDIVEKTVRATDLPVTVKLRLGVDRGSINVTECALAAESAGAAMVTVHGRTRSEMYSGAADLDEIRKVKNALHIPVIANGDIKDARTALSAIGITGADGVAIGRGAVGNPFVFSEILAAMRGENYERPTLTERCDMALCQLSLAKEEKGEKIAIPEARKQIALYLSDFRGAARLRAEINTAETYSEVEAIIRRAEREFLSDQ